MELISVTLRFSDSATADRVAGAVTDLRGREIVGSRLVFPSPDELHAIDPLLVTFAIGLVEGLVSEAGKQLGRAAIKWLVTKVREHLSPGQTATLVVKGESLEIGTTDDARHEEEFAAKVIRN